MDLVSTVEGGENAPYYFVMGVSRVEQLGPGTVRVSFYNRHDGINKVEVQLIWDQQAIMQANELFNSVLPAMKADPVNGNPSHQDNDPPPRRGAH